MKKQPSAFVQFDSMLPDELQMKLLEAQLTEKLWHFYLGDAVNEIWRWAQRKKVTLIDPIEGQRGITFRFVCGYVARKLDNDKRGADSIYNYANLAGMFQNRNVREKYSRLPISHLEYAMQFPQPKKILDYDLTILDQRGGRPQSKLDLMKHFEPERFEAQAAAAEQADQLFEEHIPFHDAFDSMFPSADLPIDANEIRELKLAYQKFHYALVRFYRRNPSLSNIANLFQTIETQLREFFESLKTKNPT